jgi:hypothetical protein
MCIVEVAFIIIGENLVGLLNTDELGFSCGALVFGNFVGMVGKSGLFKIFFQSSTLYCRSDARFTFR